ncbi:MAG: hypothetical protein M1840_002239 [Geoglossum simile]|nr:MAG: hypothetical protein M1840_002239 [Geoglossum simile]
MHPTLLLKFVSTTDRAPYNSNWPYRNKATGQITTTQALVLGLGSMFNHSRINQNVAWERDVESQVVRYTALCDIAEGQELCISYGSGLTFEDTEKLETESPPNPSSFYRMKDVSEFDKSPKIEKTVLLALKTQFTFKETAEIWGSRFHKRYNDKYLMRAYKKLKNQSPPIQTSFNHSELEELGIIARRHEWMPDEHIIFMLLIWQSGPTRVWQTVLDAFNERFNCTYRISALIAFALRYLHNRDSSDYFLRQPRGRAMALSSDEAWMMALDIAAMDVKEWSFAWLWSIRHRFAPRGEIPSARESPESTPTTETQMTETSSTEMLPKEVTSAGALQKRGAQTLTETPRPLPTARPSLRELIPNQQSSIPIIKWQLPFSIPLQFILSRPNEHILTFDEQPSDGRTSLTPIQTRQTELRGREDSGPLPAVTNQAEKCVPQPVFVGTHRSKNGGPPPGITNKRKPRGPQLFIRTGADILSPALPRKTENLPSKPVFPRMEDYGPSLTLSNKTENCAPQPVFPGTHQAEAKSAAMASVNRPERFIPPVFLGTDRTEDNSLAPSLVDQTDLFNSDMPSQAALGTPKARLKKRLGQYLSAFFDYTDLRWEEIAAVCPLGPRWDWIRPNGGSFARWEDCSKALKLLMIETMAPHPPADPFWAATFLDAHARGRSTFPKPQVRVLARIESQMRLAKRRAELKESQTR